MSQRTIRPLTAIVLGAAAACAAFAAAAGGEKVAFPADFDKGVLYATVDRHDIKQYRELYATKDAVDAVRAGRPIPSGTVLTMVQYKARVDDKGVPVRGADGRFQKGDLVGYAVMEKRAGWGAEYPEELRNGEWEYQAFGPDRKVNDKANLKSCFQCHKPHAGQDYVISLARLAGAAPAAKVEPRRGPGVVAIADFLFGPEKVEVAAGQKVTWVNTDDSPHQIAIVGKDLRTPVLLKGQSAALSFDPGAYEYVCGLHPAMKGRIEVK
ncbi:MAG: cytochrome P460 family protein [Burkholderiaceae bacterium]